MRYAEKYCDYKETYENGEHFYIFTGKCVKTHKEYSVKVPGKELYAYNQGALIQNAMPSVSRQDREFLISGFSPEGWNILFPPNESSDD